MTSDQVVATVVSAGLILFPLLLPRTRLFQEDREFFGGVALLWLIGLIATAYAIRNSPHLSAFPTIYDGLIWGFLGGAATAILLAPHPKWQDS